MKTESCVYRTPETRRNPGRGEFLRSRSSISLGSPFLSFLLNPKHRISKVGRTGGEGGGGGRHEYTILDIYRYSFSFFRSVVAAVLILFRPPPYTLLKGKLMRILTDTYLSLLPFSILF